MTDHIGNPDARAIDPIDVPRLLAASPTEQIALLRAAGAYDAAGVSDLLDIAADMIGSNPLQARALAQLCGALAADTGADEIAPKATYLRAQTHAITAECAVALTLIEQAHQGYLAIGHRHDAQRTSLGRIHALCDLGRYQEALDVGHTALVEVNSLADADATADARAQLAASLNINLATCYEEIGRFDAALTAYDAAESLLQGSDQHDLLSMVRMDRGVVLLGLGQSSEALRSFDAADQLMDDGDIVLRAQLLLNRASALIQLGRYSEALALFTQARQALATAQASADESVLLLDMADAYQALNLHAEALSAYRSSHRLLSEAEMQRDLGRALWGLGSTLIALGRHDEADAVLAESAAIFVEARNIPMQCDVMLQQAAVRAATGDRSGALSRAREALALVSRGNWLVQQARAHLLIADLMAEQGSDVMPHLLSARRLVERLALPELSAQVRQRLGREHLRQGRLVEAEKLLLAAVNDFEQRRGLLSQVRIRSAYAQGRHTPYEDLTRLYLTRGKEGDVPRAFAIAERGKSRGLADMVGNRTDGAAFSANQPARARALRMELDKIYTSMLQATFDDAEALEANQSRAIELEQELSQLQLEIVASPSPKSSTQALIEPLTLDKVREKLPANAAMIFYMICGDEIFALIVTQDDIKVARALSTVAAVDEQMQRLGLQWDRLQQDPAFVRRHMERLTQSAQAVLLEMHTALFNPIAAILRDLDATAHTTLVIVPHGILHQVPFHALFDGTRYLVDIYEISYAPSATVFAACQEQPSAANENTLIVGVPDARAPAAEQEANAIAQIYTNSRLITAEMAKISTFQSNLKDSSVIHIAAHGQFRSDNPMFSALKLHDGWLLAADIVDELAPGALVALSACESGRASVLGGDEVMGLTRAFLGAGAATVVASLWLAHDEATRALMSDWHQRMHAGETRAAGLRAAMFAVRATYAHPFFWAAFMLIGKS